MKDKQVVTWSFISLFIFLITNFLMSLPFTQLTSQRADSADLWKSTIFALVLYLIPIVLAVLDWKPSFYLLGIVIALYSLGLLGVIINMIFYSEASLLIKALMSILGAGGLLINAWWLVLALRVRKVQQEQRQLERFSKLNQEKEERETSK